MIDFRSVSRRATSRSRSRRIRCNRLTRVSISPAAARRPSPPPPSPPGATRPPALREPRLRLVVGGARHRQRLVGVVPLVPVVGPQRLGKLPRDAGIVGGALRLAFELAQTRSDLLHQQLDPPHVLVSGRQLGPRFVNAQAVALDVGRLLDELPPGLPPQVEG